MPTLPAVMVTLLLPFEHLFDPRTWRKAQFLAMGAILSPGKRTVSSALNILGIGQHVRLRHLSPRAQPCPMVAAATEFGCCRCWWPGALVHPPSRWCSALTETVERRWGRKIAAKGRYRDPVRSKDDQVVMTSRIAMGEPDVADAYRIGGSTSGRCRF